uniref:Lipase domain-containing protein n=1 Tax=Glossina brevipalpis TaxID=37001 RepID=A0A1A9W370_9MUSC
MERSFIYKLTIATLVHLSVYGIATSSLPVDVLIEKANIYYEQPLENGLPHEFPLADLSELKSLKDFKVIIHGFTASRFHNSIKPLKQAYLAQGKDNVLLADWSEAAKVDYPTARKIVRKVSLTLAKILEDFINKFNIEKSEIHVIGHSLGAHIAGCIGHYFVGSLGRVTGLDPALPLFTPKSPDGLNSDSALFVDVIHTDYPVFGDLVPRGSVDFYPNYGFTGQKGCDEFDLVTASKLIFKSYSCSHNRAVLLYAESIGLPRNFPSIPCSLHGIKSRNVGICQQKIVEQGLTVTSLREAIANMRNETVVYMGEAASNSTTGIYFLETYGAPPYGLGLYTQIL